MVVYAEHRFFGQSIPENKSKAEFLNVENAMGDYINLMQHIREKYKMKKSPVVTFGGSYGGMLAAWLRMRFPNHV